MNLLLAVSLVCLGVTVDAFSVGRSSKVAFKNHASWRNARLSTGLFADAAEESDAPQKEDHGEHTGEEWQLPDEGGSDILNSPAFLERKLEVLKSDISKVDEEFEEANRLMEQGKAEWGPQLEALEKEYENISNRMSQQSAAGDTDATILVARKFLEVLDNYDRAFGAVTAETDAEKEIEAAYKNTYKMVLDTFESLGIKEVETVGTEFDYEVHQAVMQRESEYDEGIICEELAKGYVLDDKLIRAAMVSVSY